MRLFLDVEDVHLTAVALCNLDEIARDCGDEEGELLSVASSPDGRLLATVDPHDLTQYMQLGFRMFGGQGQGG